MKAEEIPLNVIKAQQERIAALVQAVGAYQAERDNIWNECADEMRAKMDCGHAEANWIPDEIPSKVFPGRTITMWDSQKGHCTVCAERDSIAVEMCRMAANVECVWNEGCQLDIVHTLSEQWKKAILALPAATAKLNADLRVLDARITQLKADIQSYYEDRTEAGGWFEEQLEDLQREREEKVKRG